MKMRLFLLPFVLIGLVTGILNSNSTTESIVWLLAGIAGLLGVTTLGLSSKQVIKIVKSVF